MFLVSTFNDLFILQSVSTYCGVVRNAHSTKCINVEHFELTTFRQPVVLLLVELTIICCVGWARFKIRLETVSQLNDYDEFIFRWASIVQPLLLPPQIQTTRSDVITL